MIKEDWKYTSLSRFNGLDLERAAAVITSSAPAGVVLSEFSDASTSFSPTHPALKALAQSEECRQISVSGDVAEPLQLDLQALANRAGAPRIKLVMQPRSRLTLIETTGGGAGSFLGTGMMIEVQEGAELTHLRLQTADAAHSQLALLKVTQAAKSTYRHLAVSTGAALWRHEVDVALTGERALCQFDAISLLSNSQHGDITTRIRHLAPHCQSRQRVRTVLSGQSTGVFQGLIHVAPHAQKTDGQQNSRALLLSDTATINSKPELEIFADDVQCGHGSTVGALDPLALFYLQARGIPEQQARWLLIEAFVTELLEGASDAALIAARHGLEGLT